MYSEQVKGFFSHFLLHGFRLHTRVSQFRFKKSFALKRNLAKQKQFRFVSLQFRETTEIKFRFVSLRKFRFVSLKKRFASVVSLKKKFRFKSFALETVSCKSESESGAKIKWG